jgi:hypothetical protein
MPEMNNEMNDPQLKIIQRQQQSRPRNDSHRKNDHYQNYQKFKSLEEREAAYQQARARIFQEGQEPEEEEVREDPEEQRPSRSTRVQPRISSSQPRPRYYYTNYYPSQQAYGYQPYYNYSGDKEFQSDKPYVFPNPPEGSFPMSDDGKIPYPHEMAGSPVQPVMYVPYMSPATASPYGWPPNAGMLPFRGDDNGVLYYPYPPQDIPHEPAAEPVPVAEPSAKPDIKPVIRFGSVETPVTRSSPPAFSTKSHFKPNNVIVSKAVEKNE